MTFQKSVTPITFVIPAFPECVGSVVNAWKWCARHYPKETGRVLFNGQNRRFAELVVESPRKEKAYYRLLWALVACNLSLLRNRYPWSGLYNEQVKYATDPPGCELWGCLALLAEQGEGDCEDLACARVAEELFLGRSAEPYLSHESEELCQLKPNGHRECAETRHFHVRVKHASGRIEDPSTRLGMPS